MIAGWNKIVWLATFIDITNPRSIVSAVLTASQIVLIDDECAITGHSKAAAFVVIPKAAVAGLPTRSILWPDGKQRERK